MGTNFYNRDLRDLKFILFEYLDINKILGYEKFKNLSIEDLQMVIEEANKVCQEVIGPTLQDGEQIAIQFKQGNVTVPPSFHECWKIMAENGWIGSSKSPEFGGQGLPVSVAGMGSLLFNTANMAFMCYVALAIGAGNLIEEFGTEADKALFVEKMYSGRWGGSMCLTEPDAGSDNGYLRTKAIPDPSFGDPRMYKIEGTKSFITGGDHDLTENIIHLLIARIEGAPEGTKGISLFIVPKIWVNPDGSLGETNDVVTSGIEHKMGIKGSSTCTLNFGENGKCRGILLGEPNSGMRKMFQMMNEARINTGVQATGCATQAYDTARKYAKERIQGPPFTNRNAPRVRIIEHEDVRRMLMNLKAGIEACWGFAGKLFYLSDVAANEPNKELRDLAELRVELFTPLIKSYVADFSFLLCRDAIQILGGVGYCGEFPVEQNTRDCKILSIWEGINFIQSLDLVGRKLNMKSGQVFQGWLKEVADFAAKYKNDPDFTTDFDLLNRACQMLGDYAASFIQIFTGGGKIKLVPLNSTRFLDCFAETLLAQIMLEQGIVARRKLKDTKPDSADAIFYRGKVETVRYFCRNILTNVFSRHASFKLQDTSAIDIPEEAF
jgi:alkylation response protein AidB-like acyl-CoA dehydrogenase